MSKIGLVLEGGGMKCAYTAGILDAMMDNGVTFDYCIGVSAGSANGVSFVAGQRGRNIRFYTEHINEKGYFGLSSFLKTGNLFGLQYIYGTLTNSGGADPLDFDAFMKSPMEYWLVATDAQTGKPTYFSKKDMHKDDYRHVMASCAIPAVCRPVEINGRFYYDGGVSDSIPVQKAMDDGCDKLVVILTKPHNFVKEPEKDRLFTRDYAENIRRSSKHWITDISCTKPARIKCLRWKSQVKHLFLHRNMYLAAALTAWMPRRKRLFMRWASRIFMHRRKN